MGYIPEVNDVVVFSNTHDAVTEYRVNAVNDGRLALEPVPVPEGFAAFTVNLSLEMANDMGIAKVSQPEPVFTEEEVDAMAAFLALATLEYMDKFETALVVSRMYGQDLANAIISLDELITDLEALTFFAVAVDTAYEVIGVDHPSLADYYESAYMDYVGARDTSRGL